MSDIQIAVKETGDILGAAECRYCGVKISPVGYMAEHERRHEEVNLFIKQYLAPVKSKLKRMKL